MRVQPVADGSAFAPLVKPVAANTRIDNHGQGQGRERNEVMDAQREQQRRPGQPDARAQAPYLEVASRLTPDKPHYPARPVSHGGRRRCHT